MNRHSLLPGLLGVLLLLVPISGFCESVKTVDETDHLGTAFRFDGRQGYLLIGSETRTFPRQEIRDISFSRREREKDVLATAPVDAVELFAQARATLKEYPDSVEIVLRDEGTFIYHPDGTNKIRIRESVYVAKEEALGGANLTLGFEPNRSRVKILHAVSLHPDGSVYSLDSDQITLAKGSSGGEYFSQNETLSATIPNVRVGTIYDYAYEIDEFNPFDPNLFQGSFFFRDFNPVVRSRLQVILPKARKLNYLATLMPEEKKQPVVTTENDRTVHEWTFTDTSPIIPEINMPPYRDIVPRVAFTIQPDWSYQFNKLRPMFEKRFQLTDLVRKKVDEITAGAVSLEDKIARLYQFCQKEIRYISIKGSLASGQVGHPAEETLKKRLGDCTDKGMLLATMLKHLGVEAYPVGILTNDMGRAVKEIPIFDANHCIVEVYLNGKRFYLDPTATDFRYPYFREDDHDTIAENVILGKHLAIPLPPPEDNAMRVTRIIDLAADGTIKVRMETENNGPGEDAMRGSTRGVKPEEYEKRMRSVIAGLTADYELHLATHTNPLDFSGPFRTTLEYTLRDYASRSGKYLILAIPKFEMTFPEVALKERKFDLQYGTSNLRTDDVLIKIPAGFRVKYLPAPLRIKNDILEFIGEYVQEGSALRVKRSLAFLVRRVPLAGYRQHKEHLEAISRFCEERIFLEELPQTKGDAP